MDQIQANLLASGREPAGASQPCCLNSQIYIYIYVCVCVCVASGHASGLRASFYHLKIPTHFIATLTHTPRGLPAGSIAA